MEKNPHAQAVGNICGVLLVKPKPRKGVASKAIKLLELAIVKLMYRDPKNSCHHLLTSNFAPVYETPTPLTNLTVEGHLPECLDGEFLMVGPNLKFAPVAGCLWADGDGMVHGIRIKEGKAVTFVSRFVRTSQFKQEEFHGGPLFVKMGDRTGMFGDVMRIICSLRKIFQVIDTSCGGGGYANEGLEYHDGKLLVLGDVQYAIKVLENGDLQTIGKVDYDNGRHYSFTSLPKIDPLTGEMFTFCYSPEPSSLIYRVVSKDGVMRVSVLITLSAESITQDFAITESYAIFIDHPYHVDLESISLSCFDPSKKARFGILPRYAQDERLIKWFELPTCLVFYTANAWEEGNEVVLICCRYPSPGSSISELYEMRFNMDNGMAFQKRLSASHIVCPRINKSYIGRKQRYVYGMKRSDAMVSMMDSMMSSGVKHSGAMISGIVKFDLEAEPETGKTKFGEGGNVKGTFEMGPGIFGSEAVFVPRQKGMFEMGPGIFGSEAVVVAKHEPYTVEEDDGYLILFAHDHNTWKSSVMVIDAKTMSPDPVAMIELPTRVPYGSHAFFLTEDQLREHMKCS